MPHSFLLFTAPLLLQAAETTKLAAEAAGTVGHYAASTAFTSLLFLWAIAGTVGFVWQYNRATKADAANTLTQATAADKQTAAVQAASDKLNTDHQKQISDLRTGWQKEMALDLGHEQEMLRQFKEQANQQIAQLREEKKELAQQIIDGNNQLRQQVAKDAQLFEALTNTNRITARALQASNINQQEMMRVLGVAHPEANIRPPHSIDLT